MKDKANMKRRSNTAPRRSSTTHAAGIDAVKLEERILYSAAPIAGGMTYGLAPSGTDASLDQFVSDALDAITEELTMAHQPFASQPETLVATDDKPAGDPIIAASGLEIAYLEDGLSDGPPEVEDLLDVSHSDLTPTLDASVELDSESLAAEDGDEDRAAEAMEHLSVRREIVFVDTQAPDYQSLGV